MIDVVAGVIVRGGRLLLTQRRPEQDFPFRWESPGGKVEDGETPEDALRRELWEEIGVRALIVRCLLWKGVIDREVRAPVHVSLITVTLADHVQPKPVEGQGLGWFTIEELRSLTLMPANALARDAVVQFMRAEYNAA